jgi:hypothetical protein
LNEILTGLNANFSVVHFVRTQHTCASGVPAKFKYPL